MLTRFALSYWSGGGVQPNNDNAGRGIIVEWSADRIAQLRALKAQGLNARKIGLALGTTKNAIIGKLRRLNWSPGDAPPVEPLGPEAGPAKPPPPPEPPPPPKRMPQCALIELTDDACRWPIGDPGRAGFAFCGEETAGLGLPYCPAHCLVAYNPKR